MKGGIAIVGVSGAGRPAADFTARWIKAEDRETPVWLVDYDLTGPRDARLKGFSDEHIGLPKPVAAVEEIRAAFGARTASRFVPVVADARSCPGILRGAAVVLICTGSRADAAAVAAFCPSRVIRVALEVKAGRAFHSVEVAHNGAELIARFSRDDWRKSSEYIDCMGEERRNSDAAAPQPIAPVAGALALQVLANHFAAGSEEMPAYRIYRMEADKVYFADGESSGAGEREEIIELDLGYDSSLPEFFGAAVQAVGGVGGEALELDTPLVWETCGSGHARFGFERYPASNRCHCGANKLTLSKTRLLDEQTAAAAPALTLRQLYCPVGLGGRVHFGGAGRRVTLPVDLECLPPPAVAFDGPLSGVREGGSE